jgi:hypothetical protein
LSSEARSAKEDQRAPITITLKLSAIASRRAAF